MKFLEGAGLETKKQSVKFCDHLKRDLRILQCTYMPLNYLLRGNLAVTKHVLHLESSGNREIRIRDNPPLTSRSMVSLAEVWTFEYCL